MDSRESDSDDNGEIDINDAFAEHVLKRPVYTESQA